MAFFKGIKTNSDSTVSKALSFEQLREKLVRANPDWIRYRDSTGWVPTEYMNEWALTPDPEGFLCYDVRMFYQPGWYDGKPYRILVSLGANESVHRLYKTLEEANRAFDAIQPYTTIKTLENRGFGGW